MQRIFSVRKAIRQAKSIISINMYRHIFNLLFQVSCFLDIIRNIIDPVLAMCLNIKYRFSLIYKLDAFQEVYLYGQISFYFNL